jgi:four helix bundle protein
VEVETTKKRKDQGTKKRKNLKTKMTDIFRFQKFPVYILAREFRKIVKSYSKNTFPKFEQHILSNQLWRALDSLVLNIAEGSDHYSDIEFGKYLNIALTSLNEVVACLDCALDDGYINQVVHKQFLVSAEEIAKQLKAFSAKLRAKKVFKSFGS